MKIVEGLSPTSITANRKQSQVQLTWNDGHTSIYPFALLRAACPCASCRGGHENMSSTPDPGVFQVELPESEMTRMRSLELVGSYAVTVEWEDGHHYGIYKWDYLRALCPCPVCQEERDHGR